MRNTSLIPHNFHHHHHHHNEFTLVQVTQKKFALAKLVRNEERAGRLDYAWGDRIMPLLDDDDMTTYETSG